MESTVSRTSITTRYGIIAGLILIAIPLVLYMFNSYSTEGNWWNLILYILVLGACIHLAMKAVGEQVYSTGMTYGQAFGTGMLTTLPTAVITAIFTYIFLKFIAPEFLVEAEENARIQLEERGMSRDEIERAMSFTSIFISDWFMAIAGLLQTLLIGLIVSLVAAFFNQQK